MFEFLSKFEFLNRIFHREETRKTARDRLRLVIIQDRASMAPQMLEHIKEDLIAVFTKYMEIDVKSVEIGLERRDGTVALAANIPIIRIRSLQSAAPAAASRPPANSPEEEKERTFVPPKDGQTEGHETGSGKSRPTVRRRKSRVLHKRTRSARRR
jgi:cell division topological specificity factor